MRAIERADARLLTLRHSIQWEAGANAPPVLCVPGQRHEAKHAHPVAALLLAAGHAGLLDIARAEGKGAKKHVDS